MLNRMKQAVQSEYDAIARLADILGPEYEAVAEAIANC